MPSWVQKDLEKVHYLTLYQEKKGEAEGEINYNGENILDLNTEERAQKGIFLAFQYPIEIPELYK